MGHRFAALSFTPTVRELQRQAGSRSSYAAMDQGEDYNYLLSDREAGFIAQRDSMYMASVSETGWPYIQHRGGPTGFIKVIDESHIGFVDYSGNRQYVSTGNFLNDSRVALFFMDYVNRRRLKLLGRVMIIGSDHEALSELRDQDYVAAVERGFLIKVEAFDWNCPQHITPRFTQEQIRTELLSSQPQTNQEQAAPSNTEPTVLGAGPLELVVAGMRQLTEDVRSYELRRVDGGELPGFSAGSHLRIPVQLPNGELIEREYSIASNPANRQSYEIAVLRETLGRGGSSALHSQFVLGTRLRTGLPINQFSLEGDDRPSVLIAGGIGITPLRSMAYELRRTNKEFKLKYAGKSPKAMAYADELQEEFGEHVSFHTSDSRLDLKALLTTLAPETLIYACGPERLIAGILKAASEFQIPEQQIRFERFE